MKWFDTPSEVRGLLAVGVVLGGLFILNMIAILAFFTAQYEIVFAVITIDASSIAGVIGFYFGEMKGNDKPPVIVNTPPDVIVQESDNGDGITSGSGSHRL